MSEKSASTAKTATATSEAPAARGGGRAAAAGLRSPREQVLSLQRTVGNQTVQRLLDSGRIQAKLQIGRPDDPYEQEADSVAEQVMRMPEPAVRKKPACTSCPEAKKELQGAILPKRTSPGASAPAEAPAGVQTSIESISGGGQPLPASARSYFEPRFGQDFSEVRVHADAGAAEASRAIQARAFTYGNNIAFSAGEYAPESGKGRELLAHELTHVVQQRTRGGRDFLQRCPDAASDALYDEKAAAIIAHAEYGKLPDMPTDEKPGAKSTVGQIISDAKLRDNCLYYMNKLMLLFNKPTKSAADIGARARAETATAVAAEKTRTADPRQSAKIDLEQKASEGRVMTKIPGKFGGGTYSIDARDPNNIVVKAKVLLTSKGGGTADDVEAIKAMQDAIEKAASTRGYIVSIDFVTAGEANAETFRVNVDTDTWEVATNWQGGSPTGYAHELHHLFAFPLDRYDYIEAHAENDEMAISNRVHWFSQELTKPAGYNDPTSLMSDAAHPNDNDVCTVAGLPLAGCLAAREKVNEALGSITKAYYTPEERILHSIMKYSAADPATMTSVLREIFRTLFGLPEAQKVAARLQNSNDTLGILFQTLPAAQQSELLGIISP